MSLELQPITYKEACKFIDEHHRHHLPPQGWKFGIAVNDGEKVVGVITVGRPVARMLDDTWTLEVTRCCTDGTRNACSKLYSAAWRAAKALGLSLQEYQELLKGQLFSSSVAKTTGESGEQKGQTSRTSPTARNGQAARK